MIKVTILGCGASTGVPSLNGGWGDCDGDNPKNKRSRSSIILEKDGMSLLIDMSPDLRQQLLDYGSSKVDAVILTHSHYDHVNGINELRSVFFEQNRLLPIYVSKNDMDSIKKSFFYLFEKKDPEIYKPYIELHPIENVFTIGNISGICFEQNHGFSKSLGIRISDFAYSTDVVSLSDENFEALSGVDTWVVDCLSMKNIRLTHAHLDLVLEWVKKINPRQTFLTHMDTTMDYDILLKLLPKNIKPAYDQMTIWI
ncbi:MAG: MBL fold metallo-hydrolase [Holosporaceae bacterium]|jgi:phosphoribosyl 1,2-cyclic phosphate phosphodiesterase|nr:MBL fold metallo-hydrolase [Holosporaceae bacterium]